LTNPTVAHPSATKRWLWLDPNRDYIVRLPTTPLVGGGGVVIEGGRNVVLIGGEIQVPDQGAPWAGSRPAEGFPGGLTFLDARRGLYLKNQTGIVHIEGVRILGSDLAEGIDLDQRKGATVQLQNIRVDAIHARDETNFSDIHPDLIQSWAGPAELRVDRLTGTSDYQGIYLVPNEYGTQAPPRLVDLRRINIHGTQTARHLLWMKGDFPIAVTDTWISPGTGKDLYRSVWPNGSPVWSNVTLGQPLGGDFVPATNAGTLYTSPGYAS
jgi:hypothetical protein